MKYSFIVIAYNEQKVIRESIQSILALSELSDFEILVIDDASTDETATIVKSISKKHPEVILVQNESNSGRGYSRNRGVTLAKGSYVALVDADIVLPKNWLTLCTRELKQFDSVGGIAAPDGDVGYVYRIFDLEPKIVAHTTEISGGNGIFKRDVVKSMNYDAGMRDGEDVDMTWKMKKAGFRTRSIPDLVCEHREYKTFLGSLRWMYQQGVGANRLLARFHTIRLPDLTFFAFVPLLLASVIVAFWSQYSLMVPIVYFLLVSFAHMQKKFTVRPSNFIKFSLATVVNSSMISAYLIGRLFSYNILITGLQKDV